jgi:DNA-binding transcriptional regulator YiaG
MSRSLPPATEARHLLLPDTASRMAKAGPKHVRKADEALLRAIGAAVKRVRGSLSLKEFATQIDRDERQIARWEDGRERPHLDAIFSVAAFSAPMILELAALASDVELTQQITIRRRA